MGLLSWTPSQFWSATPAEIMAALRGKAGPSDMPFSDEEKTEIQRMMERFPDVG